MEKYFSEITKRKEDSEADIKIVRHKIENRGKEIKNKLESFAAKKP